MSQKDRIIILKVQKYSDAHLIVTGINSLGAKFAALAPAALKSRKRFGGGVLEPTHFVEIQYSNARSEGQLPVLKDAILIDSFEDLRKDYDRLNLSFYLLRLVEMATQETPMDSQSVFSLLGYALKGLEKTQDLASFKKHFEIKFLFTQGLLEMTPEILPFLKKKFSEEASIPYQFEDTPSYLKIRQILNEYVGSVFVSK